MHCKFMGEQVVRRCVRSLMVFLLLWIVSGVDSISLRATPLPLLRRVNAPGFGAQGVQGSVMAILWFGRVTSSDNYNDVRVGYNNQELVINMTVFDRQVWTEDTPSALTQWDGATLYLDLDGNTGTTLDSHSLRFDGEATSGSAGRSSWQAASRGNGAQWQSVNIAFTTESGWNVAAPNDDVEDDRGWIMEFHIPFTALGLSGPPPQGTIWGMATASHDRDGAAGPVRDGYWPSTLNTLQPATWGQLYFGQPAYQPPTAIPHAPLVIRNGLNGTAVPDADVGGHTDCGANYWPHYFNGWGDANYAEEIAVNVQNQAHLGDWPCFSKYYVTFPLTAIPANKVIISSTLTLYQFGNTGGGQWGPPATAHTQVLTVDSDWNEATLSWNNAPAVRENIAIAQIDPLPETPHPDVPRTWDVSRAVAEAYGANEPLRLALYAADLPAQTGRYFRSSDFGGENVPTLTIVWGDNGATVHKTAWPPAPFAADQVTYTLAVLGSGNALTLTDDLPNTVSAPGGIQVLGGGTAGYNAGAHRVQWTGTPAAGQKITVTFPVTVLAENPIAIVNRVTLLDGSSSSASDTAIVIANAYQVALPIIRH